MKIIILNGPPESGKDTLADYVVQNIPYFHKMKFAAPLKGGCKEMYGLTETQVAELESNRALKDAPNDLLFGRSWRQVNIDLSENYMKPKYGLDVFGKILVNSIKTSGKERIIVSDGGFDVEIPPLIKAFGAESILMVRLSRDGTDYSKDSRSYIDAKALGIRSMKLHNDNLLDARLELYSKVRWFVDDYFDSFEQNGIKGNKTFNIQEMC